MSPRSSSRYSAWTEVAGPHFRSGSSAWIRYVCGASAPWYFVAVLRVAFAALGFTALGFAALELAALAPAGLAFDVRAFTTFVAARFAAGPPAVRPVAFGFFAAGFFAVGRFALTGFAARETFGARFSDTLPTACGFLTLLTFSPTIRKSAGL